MVPVYYAGSGLDVEPAILLTQIASHLNIPKKQLKLICIDPLNKYAGSGYWSHQNIKIKLKGKYIEFHQIPVEEFKRPEGEAIILMKGSVTGDLLYRPGDLVVISSNTIVTKKYDNMTRIKFDYFTD